jgi:hypothetical protein
MPAASASYAEAASFVMALPWQEADILMLALPEAGVRQEVAGPSFAPLLAWEGIRDALDVVNYLRLLEDAGGNVANGGGTEKRLVLEGLAAALKEARAKGITLRWRGHRLVTRGRPAAVVAIDPAFTEQGEAAEMLNQIVQSRTGVSLPVVSLGSVAAAPHLAVAVTFGSPSTNRMISELAGAREDELRWRLRANGCWLAEYRDGGTEWLALMAADPEQWGGAVARFAAGLEVEF